MRPITSAERPRFLTDEDFNLAVVAGLRRARPQIDVLTLQTAGMLHMPDPRVLEYAKELDRILLSHDVHTMPDFFATYLMNLPAGEHHPGIILVAQDAPIGVSILWLLEIWEASRHEEWQDLPTRLPL